MGIRDILMLVLGYGCVPLALYNAYYGLLAYCWLSFMNPQRLVWSPTVQEARIIFVVGAALIIRAFFSAGPKIRLSWLTVSFLILGGWFAICTLTSTHLDLSTKELILFSKVAIAALLITGLVQTRKQLKWMMILLALCPGIWAIKFGQYFLRTGAISDSGGPFGDNNDTAVFIALCIPLLVFCTCEVKTKRVRWAMYIAAGLAVPAVLLTGSRGGLLTLAGAVALTVWRKIGWWQAIPVGAAITLLVFWLLPSAQSQRYETIRSFEQDPSAMSRIWAWKTSLAMAADRPVTGIGFGQEAYIREYNSYKVLKQDRPHAAHSIWFSTLAETGYVGLGLYVMMLLSVLLATRRIMKQTARQDSRQTHWAWNYAAAIQCALLTFMIGGTFLSQTRSEFVFALCMIVVPLSVLVKKEAQSLPTSRHDIGDQSTLPTALGSSRKRR